MMPRKKRKIILIVSIISIVAMIAMTLIFLYITTDSFKSSRTLFSKYLGQNVENWGAMQSENKQSEYEELLEQSKYTTNTEVTVNYTENVGTDLENTENVINELKLEIKGQTDNSKEYNYQDIYLLKNDEKLSELEYIQSGEVKGIRFPELFSQYLVASKDDVKEILQKAGQEEQETSKLWQKIDFNGFPSLTPTEQQTIKNKYINLINRNLSEDNFSKQKNQTIQMDGKAINVNAYTLTLTKEQMNSIYLKMLEEMKQDEIILKKLDDLQIWLEPYQMEAEMNLREEFIQKIDSLMSDITRNNIGQEQAKITVYENYHTTVRTVIQNPEYEITIDLLSLSEENYVQFSYQDEKNKKKQVVTYKKTGRQTSIDFERTEKEQTKKYQLVNNQKVNGNQCEKNKTFLYEDDSNKVEASIKQEINIVDIAEEDVIQKEENFINLSELEEEQLQTILEQAKAKISEETTKVTNHVKKEEVLQVLKVVGLVKENQNFENTGITETEKKRFNSKFEILQGENLENKVILNLIDAIKSNLVDIEVVSGTELKLKLDRLRNNEEVVTNLTTFMEQSKNQKYNAKVEYDETTGLVSSIVLTRVVDEKKR
jgi:hypothetical protein